MEDGIDDNGKSIRERALTSIDKLVKWVPKSGRNRLFNMVSSRPDWVLSRQRAWGVPLTCFVKKGYAPEHPEFILKDPKLNKRMLQ